MPDYQHRFPGQIRNQRNGDSLSFHISGGYSDFALLIILWFHHPYQARQQGKDEVLYFR